MTPTATHILRDEDYAVFVTFVDGAGRTSRHTGRIQAVIAKARQVFHKNIVEIKGDVLAYFLKVHIGTGRITAG